MREREGFAGYGYETAGGDRVTALRDMFDGGGAGRSGEEFEGGGILSLIANLLASPYGSERERTAGIIDQPTRPPRTRPAPPPAQPAADARSSREANLPTPRSTSLFSDYDSTLYDYYRQGGPGGPFQTAPSTREANLPGPRPTSFFPDYGPPSLTMSEELMAGETPALTYEQASAVLSDPSAPDQLRSQAAMVIAAYRQDLKDFMLDGDRPLRARGAQRLLGEEDRVGIDPRTGRVSSFGASIPR